MIELADAIAVNKADGTGSDKAAAAAAEYRSALHILIPGGALWSPPVLLLSGLHETGLDELWAEVLRHRATLERAGELAAKRKRQDLKWMWALVDDRIRQKLVTDPACASGCPRSKPR